MASTRAATFRDAAGATIGTTDGSTACWAPRRPSRFSIQDERGASEHVIRCGECGGCRELDRRRLAARLVELYAKEQRKLWILTIDCLLTLQSQLAASLRRSLIGNCIAGTYRISSSQIALVVVDRPKAWRASNVLRRQCFAWKVIRNPSRKRAYRGLTGGCLIPRIEWGEQVKRWYHRGLPKREHDRWLVSTRSGVRSRHSQVGITGRGIRDGVSVHVPESYKPARLLRRRPIDAREMRLSDRMIDKLSVRVPARVLGPKTALLPLSPRGFAARSASDLERPRVSALPHFPPKNRTLNSIKGTGYKSSLRSEVNAWAARMIELARKRGSPPSD